MSDFMTKEYLEYVLETYGPNRVISSEGGNRIFGCVGQIIALREGRISEKEFSKHFEFIDSRTLALEPEYEI